MQLLPKTLFFIGLLFMGLIISSIGPAIAPANAQLRQPPAAGDVQGSARLRAIQRALDGVAAQEKRRRNPERLDGMYWHPRDGAKKGGTPLRA